MVAYIERRSSRTAYWSRRIALFDAVLFATAGIAHRFEFIGTKPLFLVLFIVGMLAVVALVLAGIGFSMLWERGDRGGKAAAAGTAIALLVLMPFFYGGYRIFAYPRLVDISTDLVDPPRFRAALLSRTSDMNPLGTRTDQQAQEQAEFYPEVIGRRYDIPADRVYATIYDLIEQRGWTMYGPPSRTFEPPAAFVEAVAKTLVFGFQSDVVVRVVEDGEGALVDMRSVSRFGVHDLGDNAARLDGFLGELDDRLGLLPPA